MIYLDNNNKNIYYVGKVLKYEVAMSSKKLVMYFCHFYATVKIAFLFRKVFSIKVSLSLKSFSMLIRKYVP